MKFVKWRLQLDQGLVFDVTKRNLTNASSRTSKPLRALLAAYAVR